MKEHLTLLKHESIKNTSKVNQHNKIQKFLSFVRCAWLHVVQCQRWNP